MSLYLIKCVPKNQKGAGNNKANKSPRNNKSEVQKKLITNQKAKGNTSKNMEYIQGAKGRSKEQTGGKTIHTGSKI